MKSRRVHVTGVVQGVGFRPYTWALARELGLGGWVRNSSSGVDIVVEGKDSQLDAFVKRLRTGAPPQARIEAIEVKRIWTAGFENFEILESREEAGAYVAVSPDIATCPECLRELRDPDDWRYRYPFINCTNCGPRFTIVRDTPYDRASTTMSSFPMCPSCDRDYRDPSDRRFHAQPVACPACGPSLWLEEDRRLVAGNENALAGARDRIAAGALVAIKGLGGFHLACDASNPVAVSELRRRKHRDGKPFALMVPDLAAVDRIAKLTESTRTLLESPERPIVLLEARTPTPLAPEVAPGRNRLGIMLPYTPLHHLLLERAPGFPEIMVMTSGNSSDLPMVYQNDEARNDLRRIADALLFHDREIYVPCDDSVMAEYRSNPYFLRRARGYEPLPIALPFGGPSVLALGGELKTTFCHTRDELAFVSHDFGNPEYLATLMTYFGTLDHYQKLFRIFPEYLVHDDHPDYTMTRDARIRGKKAGLTVLSVQHHHAHVAACLADNGRPLDERVIGVAFDGSGYGPDGAVWGGEFLLAGYADYERPLHLAYCPLPGGDAAVRKPYRTALAWLRNAGVAWEPDLEPVLMANGTEREVLGRMVDRGLNAPPTSSVGRLFDAAASIAGVCHRIAYEGQAACEFEALVDPTEPGSYPMHLSGRTLDPAPAIQGLVRDWRRGAPVSTLAARFHHGLADAVVNACRRLRAEGAPPRVALSGGVWQNLYLLDRTVQGLEAEGFDVLVHRQVPANDGGLALGQAAVALARLRARPASRAGIKHAVASSTPGV